MMPKAQMGAAVLLLAFAIALGLALATSFVARNNAVTLTRIESDRAHLASRREDLERSVADAEAEKLALQRTLNELPTTNASPESDAPQPPRATDFDLPVFLREHPEFETLYLASAKASELLPYGALIQALRLTLEHEESFKTELVRHEQKHHEHSSLARSEGWPAARLLAARREEDDVHARELTTLLGETGYAQFRQYENVLPMRNLVNELAQHLYYTDSPLDAAKADQLTQILARHAVSKEGKIATGALDWGAAIVEAQGLLSPEQIARLQTMQETRQLNLELNKIQRRARAQASGGG